MIKDNAIFYPVQLMCKVLEVSPSGYYEWLSRKPSEREKTNNTLAHQIKKIFDLNKSRAGAVRVTKALKDEGVLVGRHRVARLMRLNGWRAKAARKYKATTNSNHGLPVAPNLLNQNFNAVKPNEKWVTDITYISTDEGWLYLAAIMDLYSRKLIGWALSERMTSGLVIDALHMVLWRGKMPCGVIVHSDSILFISI